MTRPRGAALAWLALLTACVGPPPPPPVFTQPVYGQPGLAPQAFVPPEVAPSAGDPLGRLAATPGIAVPPAEPVATEAGPATVTRLVLGEAVLFDTDRDQPRADAAPVLALLAAAIRAQGPGTAVTVLGHTDATGGDAYNMALSQRRAGAVIAALAGLGVVPAAMTAVAVGRRQPVASDATAEGRARNRRVELLLSPSLAANLAAAVAHAGTGEVAVLQAMPDAALRPAGSLRLGPEAPPPQPRVAGPAVRVVRPAAPTLRLNQPDAVRLAPLGPAVTY